MQVISSNKNLITCVSFQSFSSDMHLLFVATGIYDAEYLTSVEIINLDQSNQNLICDPIPDFPVGFYAGTGQLVNVRNCGDCHIMHIVVRYIFL
jgi:hypothetical protein